MASTLKTYSRTKRTLLSSLPSSPPSVLASPTPTPKAKAKKAAAKPPPKAKAKTFTQLHFCIDQTILRTCALCGLSYTKGAPDDEALHKAHCARVQKGMEWGREEEKEQLAAGVVEVASGVKLKDRKKGRIICFKADVGGKIGSKLSTLLNTINLALSSPSLTPEILQASKVYLFLTPSITSTLREKIVGCVIAQQISTAVAIATPTEYSGACEPPSPPSPTTTLVGGIFCHPAPLPTPLGISRLFVSSTHRRQGVASHLLTAAAETFVLGCPLDPRKGQVAFSQPTGDGSAVMHRWGGGGVRIYEE
ncbi:hypothetical protein B0H16DRAFT_1660670 [Mycena metata]|uniref:N-acetyltransferase ECO1 n=1 Tax=Mycena metata TaxID=1033252 RepID=A0AAD7JW11_9AGAR|nr:hypothetical protein B0H16DRAFT_1660670 [Mycena metata]